MKRTSSGGQLPQSPRPRGTDSLPNAAAPAGKRACHTAGACASAAGQLAAAAADVWRQAGSDAVFGHQPQPHGQALLGMQQQGPGATPFAPHAYTTQAATMAAAMAAQLMAQRPEVCLPSASAVEHQQHRHQGAQMIGAARFPFEGARPSNNSGSTTIAVEPGSLLSQLRQQQHQQQHHQQQLPALARLPQEWRPMAELQRLLPRLNQEYRREMQLLLKACQVAGCVLRCSAPAAGAMGGSIMVLDPAAREQLQHQVLSNCNDKHAAVTAAFRVAAQAVAAAASSGAAAGSKAGALAAAAVAVEALGGGGGSGSARPAAGSLVGLADAADSDAASEAVAEALHQLRSSYHQELVAATSALFAICRGFGQTSAMAAASSSSIKRALVAAQQQHVRVEQLWQELLVAAAGGRSQ